MANPWFRMYSEFAHDPKIQMLNEAYQRRYIMILCLHCCNGDVTLHDTEVAFQMRISVTEWEETKADFLKIGIITENNEPASWDKRQHKTDNSNERVKAYREREKAKKEAEKKKCNGDVTLPKQKSNRLDTDTDTDTDTDNKKTKAKKDLRWAQDKFENNFWPVYPLKKSRAPSLEKWLIIFKRPNEDLLAKIIISIENQKCERELNLIKKKFVPEWKHATTWLNQKCWDDEVDLSPAAGNQNFDKVDYDYGIGPNGEF